GNAWNVWGGRACTYRLGAVGPDGHLRAELNAGLVAQLVLFLGLADLQVVEEKQVVQVLHRVVRSELVHIPATPTTNDTTNDTTRARKRVVYAEITDGGSRT